MKSNHFWRVAVLLLIVLNLLFWLWRSERLRVFGLGPATVQEPQRLENQISAELLRLKPAVSGAALAAP